MSFTVYVVDESNNNGRADLNEVKNAGITGAIFKVSEGTGFIDPTFISRARQAHDLGLIVGAYHFGQPSQDAQRQADIFSSQIQAAGVPIPLRCADVEVAGGNVQQFCDIFVPAAHCQLLYSGRWFSDEHIPRPVAGNPLWWLSGYGSQRPMPAWGTEAGWQFTSSWTCPGTSDQFDMSVFDSDVWARLIGSAPGDDALNFFLTS